MEIAGIKGIMTPPVSPESASGRAAKSVAAEEPGRRTETSKDMPAQASRGDPPEVRRLPAKDAEAPSEKESKNAGEESIEGLATRIKEAAADMRFNLRFVVDKQGGEVVIKVLDGEGKVVRQIPPEAMAELAKSLGVDAGLLVNTQL